MKKASLFILFILAVLAFSATGRVKNNPSFNPDEFSSGISGTVLDSVSGKPVDYATVTIIDQSSISIYRQSKMRFKVYIKFEALRRLVDLSCSNFNMYEF